MRCSSILAPRARALYTVVLLTCATAALYAQQPTAPSRIPLQQMAGAFSPRMLVAHAHPARDGGTHLTKSASAVAEIHAPTHAPATAAATTSAASPILSAFKPAQRSALSVGARRQPHLPPSALPSSVAGQKSLGIAPRASHMPPARPKP